MVRCWESMWKIQKEHNIILRSLWIFLIFIYVSFSSSHHISEQFYYSGPIFKSPYLFTVWFPILQYTPETGFSTPPEKGGGKEEGGLWAGGVIYVLYRIDDPTSLYSSVKNKTGSIDLAWQAVLACSWCDTIHIICWLSYCDSTDWFDACL